MFGTFARRVIYAGTVVLAAAAAADAQWFPGPSCGSCASAAPVIAPPVAMANPCNICAQPVACMQPIQQTVYKEVPVTTYKPVQKTVQRPVVRTVYEDRPITAYRQVMESKTVEVPSTAYQTVTECQQMTANRSYWQTTYQPVPKISPCQYDPNPTFIGMLNRNMYAFRSAFTPNYIRQRQYVPNVVAYNVPVQRTVAVPTTRQVTYNVARLEPYETTQRVAVNKVEYVDTEVTAYEPVTEMRTVAVGVSTQYAFVDPLGISSTATASRLEPTPTAAGDIPVRSRTADRSASPTPATTPARSGTSSNSSSSSGELFQPLSYPSNSSREPEPTPDPSYYDARVRETAPEATPSVVLTTGWRARRVAPEDAPVLPPPSETGAMSEVSIAAR
jgi:hypothetical protein